jgi:hypothetical protein
MNDSQSPAFIESTPSLTEEMDFTYDADEIEELTSLPTIEQIDTAEPEFYTETQYHNTHENETEDTENQDIENHDIENQDIEIHDIEIHEHQTLEQLHATLDAILMQDDTNEAGYNNDNSTTSANDAGVDPDPDDLTFVRFARLRSKGMRREMYEELRQIIRAFKVELPSLRRAESRLQRWTGICSELIDCCTNSCLAYTGTFKHTSMCPHCKEPRYSATGRSRSQFLYTPLAQRLVLQYSDASRARVLRSYRQTYSEPSEDINRHQLRDVFDGALYHDFHLRELGLFKDPHDIALHLSLDGVQITNLRTHEVRSITAAAAMPANQISLDHSCDTSQPQSATRPAL